MKNVKKFKKNKKLYIINKNAIKRNILVVSLLALILILSNNVFANKDIKTSEIIVEKNDTLWSIASKISNDTHTNIQEIIYKIREINNLETAYIYEGQTLYIPLYN